MQMNENYPVQLLYISPKFNTVRAEWDYTKNCPDLSGNQSFSHSTGT